VFDLARYGYTAWRAATIPMVAALAAIALLIPIRRAAWDRSRERQISEVVAMISTAGCCLIAFVIVASTWSEYSTLSRSIRAGHYRIIIGRVAHLTPERSGGHPIERFSVGADSFWYSSSATTSAFHTTVAKGGPIREGLFVRIFAVNGAIVRLDTAVAK
jgi:hypothetical protein